MNLLLKKSPEFSEIIQKIKDTFLGKQAFPKLIIGTGLSIHYGLPGMHDLSLKLDSELHSDTTFGKEWESIYSDVQKNGLERALLNKDVSLELSKKIKSITSKYILSIEKEKLYEIYNNDTGFTTLLKHLKLSVSVNKQFIDIMTLNYDRVIEVCSDRVGIDVCTGFEGQIYSKENYNYFLKNTRNVCIRLYKPHGSINIVSNHNGIVCCNDNSFLLENVDDIQIVTPGKSKYELSLVRSIFSRPREMFDNLLTTETNYSIVTFGYGFGDDHINNPIFDALKNYATGLLIISYEVPQNIIEMALKNSKIVIFCRNKNVNTLIYECHEYELEDNMSDIDEFSKIIF